MQSEQRGMVLDIVFTAAELTAGEDLVVFYDGFDFETMQVVDQLLKAAASWHHNPNGSIFAKGAARNGMVWSVMLHNTQHPRCLQITDRQAHRLGVRVYGTFSY